MECSLPPPAPPAPPDAPAPRCPQLELSSSRVGLDPCVMDSENRPVCRGGVEVVFTRIRYGPRLGNVRDTRAAQPGPPSSLMMELSRSSPRMIRTGSKSSDARSTVTGPDGAVN